MHDIERRRRKARVAGIAQHDLDVAELAGRDHFSSHRKVTGVGIDADDPTGWPHPVAEQLQDAGRSASEVDRDLACPEGSAIEECCIRSPFVSLT